jgi:hypothetical protein
MATATAINPAPFSLHNFQRLFSSSPASKYLTRFEVDQIREAMEKKNLPLLQKLYVVLHEERATDEELTRNFVMAKNRIMDDFMVEAKEIEQKYVEIPKRKASAKKEAAEKAGAEDILKQI